MLEEIIHFATSINPMWLYLLVFVVAFIENIFPPFPSDVIVAFAGSISALGPISLPVVVLLAVGGSTSGFIVMYLVGKFAGNKILEKGKIKFISLDGVHKLENWFRRYGLWLIVANRFLAGTRAIISFFAGMSELNLMKIAILSAVSALVWNIILVMLGYAVGHNLYLISDYISTYNKIVITIIGVVFIFFIIRFFVKRSSTRKS